jgi:hypothetical protein
VPVPQAQTYAMKRYLFDSVEQLIEVLKKILVENPDARLLQNQIQLLQNQILFI